MLQTLVFIHVVAAAILVGGGALVLMLGVRALATADPARAEARARELAAAGRFAGPRLFAPSAVVLIAFGAWAAADAGLDYADNAWLLIGVAVWAIAALVAGPLHARNGRALLSALDADGWNAARPVLARDTALGAVEVALVIFAVWAMVAKP